MSAVVKLQTGPKPVPVIEVISPERAESYLKTMVGNRPLSQAKVIEYASAMDEGRWSLNGETIKFDDEGRLFDGQQRLNGCILAAKSFRTWVIRGIDDPNAFATVDTGKVRTHSDIFGIAGWQNNQTASSAAMLILLYERKRINWGGVVSRVARKSVIAQKVKSMPSGSSYATRAELVAFAEEHRDSLEQSVRAANGSKASRLMPSATAAALHYICKDKSLTSADEFLRDLGEGDGLSKGDAVYVLREKLVASKTSKAKLTRWAIFGLAIKAWNKRRAGEYVQTLRIDEAEKFPVVK